MLLLKRLTPCLEYFFWKFVDFSNKTYSMLSILQAEPVIFKTSYNLFWQPLNNLNKKHNNHLSCNLFPYNVMS